MAKKDEEKTLKVPPKSKAKEAPKSKAKEAPKSKAKEAPKSNPIPQSRKRKLVTEEPRLRFEEYLDIVDVHPGLVASFKAEKSNSVSVLRTKEGWAMALEEQRKRVYSYKV